MTAKAIAPQAARQLIERGALLVDIRAADEHAREHIAQARHVPIERLAQEGLPNTEAPAVIFHCRSGNRTRLQAAVLGGCTTCDAYILEGGLDAWKKAGLPVQADRTQPLELQRQVQIAAGSLVLLGVVLGSAVSPWFYALSGFVGAGLMFAGVSGFCGLARLLMVMPWNRHVAAGPAH